MRYIGVFLVFLLSACSGLPTPVPQAEPIAVVGKQTSDIRPVIRPEQNGDTIEQALLGATVASLGNPAEPGLWMKTPLVQNQQSGVVAAANGKSVAVTLIPLDGPATGGSQLSLQAMRELGFSLTDLPEVLVTRG